MIKIILRENKKLSLLKEITMEQALVAITSKATKKVIFNYVKQLMVPEATEKQTQEVFETCMENFPATIQRHITTDLDENQKAQCVIWLKNFYLSNLKRFEKFIYHAEYEADLRRSLERFFQFKNFIEPREMRDLNKVKDFDTLYDLVNDARPRYEQYQQKKDNADAEKGTEVIYEDERFKIFIPHNKGAACELGKGTDWCTAAPGLDYYKQYHKEDDPLFIIFDKQTEIETNKGKQVQKYQFHYGTAQFMDESDTQIEDRDLFRQIHQILEKTVRNKYPKIFNGLTTTDYGVSKVNIEQNSDGTFDLEQGDLMTGATYGGDRPTVRVSKKIDDNGTGYTEYRFLYTTIGQDYHGNAALVFHKVKPSHVIVAKYDDEIKLSSLSWRSSFDNKTQLYHSVADWFNGDLDIEDEEEWNKNYKEYYYKHIRGKEEEYIAELMKYYNDTINQNQK